MLYTSVCFILGFVKFLNTLSLTFPVLGELLGHSFISKQISLWSDDYWCPCWNLVQFGTFVALVFSLSNLEVFTCWLIRPHFFFFFNNCFYFSTSSLLVWQTAPESVLSNFSGLNTRNLFIAFPQILVPVDRKVFMGGKYDMYFFYDAVRNILWISLTDYRSYIMSYPS